jgi:Ala-tRNA(Pro) deacylase
MAFLAKLETYLKQNRVAYKHTVHPVAFTAREVASAEHLPPREVAKVVIVNAGDDFYMAVLPANRVLDLTELRTSFGLSHARLATELEISRLFPDCEVGAMPPFGNLYNMKVYVDSALALDDWIAFNAGTHTDVVHMRFADFRWLVDPVILPLAREMELSRGW